MILVIANLRRWTREGRGVPRLQDFRFVALEALTPSLLRDVEVVLSALIDDGPDALEVARRLRDLRFSGRYRALTGPIPDVDAVRAEVRAEVPGLDFDLFVTDSPPG